MKLGVGLNISSTPLATGNGQIYQQTLNSKAL